jgi:hypothetical protein
LFSYGNWDEIRQKVRSKKAKLVLGCCIALFGALVLSQLLSVSAIDKRNRSALQKFETMIDKINPTSNQLYISWGAALRIQYFKPFESPMKYKQFNYIISGWTTNSPLNDKIFSKFQVVDVYLSLINNQNLYLICNENAQKLLTRFMKEHYDIEISYKTINDFGRIKVVQVLQI